jgi:EAL domain-containing protein (putative c-di-GMP-specific phosphodiesterase class I)
MSNSATVEKLRQQRDRFIAFAFAGADLLLEIKNDGTVLFSAGAAETLYGFNDEDLLGKLLADLVHPRDRKRLDDALAHLQNTGRLDHTPLALTGATGAVSRLRMSGIRLPQFTCFHLSFARVPHIVLAQDAMPGQQKDPKVDFAEMVVTLLNEANRLGREVALTLMDLPPAQFRGFEPNAANTLVATIQHTLEEVSVGGNSSARLSTASFGLVHERDKSGDHILSHLDGRVGAIKNRQGQKAQLRSATVNMDDTSLSNEDMSKALLYIINSYHKDGDKFSFTSLREGAREAIEDTLLRVRNFRNSIRSGQLTLVFQPAVNLATGAVLNYEAYVRLNHNGVLFTPTHILAFANEAGLTSELDIAVCDQALSQMRDGKSISPLAQVVLNISCLSLTSPLFFKLLQAKLTQYKPLLGRLILELDDTAQLTNLGDAKRLVAKLRAQGIRISLGDFSGHGRSIELLRSLAVDFVKLDQSVGTDATDPRGLAVLKAISGLCKELNVTAIAESVEDPRIIKILRDNGVAYAQGYSIEKPGVDCAAQRRSYAPELARLGLSPTPSGLTG